MLGFSGSTEVKNLPTVQGIWAHPLGQEDPLEKEMATIPVFSPRKSHGQRSLAGYSSWGCKRVRHDFMTIQQQQNTGGQSRRDDTVRESYLRNFY